MIKYKYIIIPLFFLLISLSSCGTNDDTDAIYYAPFQGSNCGLVDNKIYFWQNNILYQFNEEKLSLDEVCVRSNPNEPCTAVSFVPGSYLYSSNNTLYNIDNSLYFEVDQLNNTTWERSNVAKFNAQTSMEQRPCIGNNYCYYVINRALSYSSKVQIRRVPLNEPDAYKHGYEPDILWESKTPSRREWFTVNQLDTYDKYVIFTVEFVEPVESIDNAVVDKSDGSDGKIDRLVNRLFVYDEENDKFVIDGLENIKYAGYSDHSVIFIDETTHQIEVLDIETQKIISSFPLESYKKGVTLACDSDYIYINYQGIYFEATTENVDSDANVISEKYFMRIDIYSYDGKLIRSIDLSKMVNSSLCAQYLYSTNKYVFIGEPGHPLCRELYVLEKSSLKQENEVPIIPLYIYSE